MDWKEELGSQGPVPSGNRTSRSVRDDADTAELKRLVKEQFERAKTPIEGPIELGLAPLSRFPWEVRYISPGTLRVYKGHVRSTNSAANEDRNAFFKIAGKTRGRIRIEGNRIVTETDANWIPNYDQRDPLAVPPTGGLGSQVAWPPKFINGDSGAVTSIGNSRDPEPKTGTSTFESGCSIIGKNGYGASGSDDLPWFDFPYVTGPIWLAAQRNPLDNKLQYGVFCGSSPGVGATWQVLIAYVQTPELIHQFWRSDVVYGVDVPPGGTTGQVLTKKSDDDWDADWETPEEGGGGGPSNDWDHPFRVKFVTVGEESNFILVPGTVNNVVVTPSGAVATPGPGPFKCYIEITWSGTPKVVSSVDFICSYVTLYSDDTVARVLIAEVQADSTVNQYVTGSLWADRIKVAGADARYYFARI
jgi:hypothetical protein